MARGPSTGATMRVKLLEDAITLFVVINPVGLVPRSIAITRDESPERRRRIAGRVVLIAAGILIVFIALGQIALEGLRVSPHAFRVAGGLVLLVVAPKMVLSDADTRARAAPA